MDAPPARTSKAAFWSLILGLAGVVLGFLTGIPAAILGHVGLVKINRSRGALTGKGKAVTGMVLGYVAIGLSPVMLMIAAIVIPQVLMEQRAALEHDLAMERARAELACEQADIEARFARAPFLCADAAALLHPSQVGSRIVISSAGDADHDGSDDGCRIIIDHADTILAETWTRP